MLKPNSMEWLKVYVLCRKTVNINWICSKERDGDAAIEISHNPLMIELSM